MKYVKKRKHFKRWLKHTYSVNPKYNTYRIIMDKIISKLLEIKWLASIKANTAPRWMVLFVDLIIISCSYLLLATSEAFIPGHSVSSLVFLRNWGIVLAVYLLMIFITKSYTSVIRLSVFEDLYREFLVVAGSTILLLIINAVLPVCSYEDLARSWNIVIIGAISFSFLVMERLLIKHAYTVLRQYDSSERKRVLVLGTSIESIILANALKSEIGGEYYPIGLLAEKGTNPPAQISGFKVFPYDENTLVNTFVENSIHALIFNHDKVKLVGREYADFFINNNLRILSLNHVEKFSGDENGDDKGANISTHVKNVQIEDLLGRDPIVLDNSLVRSNIRGSVVMITGAAGSLGKAVGGKQAGLADKGKAGQVDQRVGVGQEQLVLENRAVLVAGGWKQLVFIGGDGLGGHGLKGALQCGYIVSRIDRRT